MSGIIHNPFHSRANKVMVAALQQAVQPALVLQWLTITDRLGPGLELAGQAFLQHLIHFSWKTF